MSALDTSLCALRKDPTASVETDSELHNLSAVRPGVRLALLLAPLDLQLCATPVVEGTHGSSEPVRSLSRN
eukprot:1068950-Pelagomonas_calceolata.AAC.1